MATMKGRQTCSAEGRLITLEALADADIRQGALVAVDATGKAVPAQLAADLVAMGCAIKVDVGRVLVERGVHGWDNSATNPLTAAHIGRSCYMEDDCTVSSLAEGGSVAGKVLGFDGDQVMVETR